MCKLNLFNFQSEVDINFFRSTKLNRAYIRGTSSMKKSNSASDLLLKVIFSYHKTSTVAFCLVNGITNFPLAKN